MAGRLISTNTAGAQYRARYDATNYADFTVSSAGDLTIAPTGGDTSVTGRLLTTGTLGVGTTDTEAWSSAYRAMQLGAGGALMSGNSSATDGPYLISNAYYDGAWKYRSTGEAARVTLGAGQVVVYVAPSGTIDTALTWTTSLSITNAGHLKPLLPTSTTGLAAGTLWNDAGTVKVA